MLVKKMLISTIKKKKVLFFAMLLVVFLSSAFTSGFATCYTSFKSNINKYVNECVYPDITLVAEEGFTHDLKDIEVEGIEKVEPRIVLYGGILSGFSANIVKITSYKDDSFLKQYVVDDKTAESSNLKINLDFVYAKNNGISAGKSIKIYKSASKTDYTTCFVDKLVGTPETIYPMVQYGFQADKYNFGYAFVKENDLKRTSKYQDAKYSEIIVKVDKNADLKKVANELTEKVTSKGIKVKTTILKSESLTFTYIDFVLNNFYSLSIVVPLGFSLIAALLLFLFLYQITKSMTQDMGILNALGVSKSKLFLLLLSFGSVVALIGSVLGIGVGFGGSYIVYNAIKYTYSMPYGSANFNILLSLLTIGVTLLVSALACLTTIFSIHKLSPKEAMINNMDKNKELPRRLDNLTRKNIHLSLAVNSMHKNKTRFFVSLFAIFASFTVSFGASAFQNSSNYYVNELNERIKYDAQIYTLGNNIDEVEKIIDDQITAGNVTKKEKFYSSTFKFTFNNQTIESNICAIDPKSTLVTIPGNIKVSDGIVLESTYASKVNAKVGDIIKVDVNGALKEAKVSAISNLYSEKYNYTSLDYYKEVFGETYGYSSFLVNYRYKNNLALALLDASAIPLYSNELIKTYTAGCSLLVTTANISIVVCLLISLISLTIMSQGSLLEQKRKLSSLMVLGFERKSVMKICITEMIIYSIIGIIIGIPCGIGFNALLISLTKNDNFGLPFINPWWAFLLTAGLIIITISINLFIDWLIIRKWNIATNIKNRE